MKPMPPEHNTDISTFYREKITAFGASPQGVGWNGAAAQEIRFKQLCSLLPKDRSFSLVDLGCGYGELYYYINKNITKDFSYIGLDISEEMLSKAKSHLPESMNISLKSHHSNEPLPGCDFVLSSGTFNIKGSHTDEEWKESILNYIDSINQSTRLGFAMNFLTSFSDPEKKREGHYYCDPCMVFSYLKNHVSKNVSLLHDYELYDFTVIVKKEKFFV